MALVEFLRGALEFPVNVNQVALTTIFWPTYAQVEVCATMYEFDFDKNQGPISD